MFKLHQSGSNNEKRKPLKMIRRLCKGQKEWLKRLTVLLALSRNSTSHLLSWRVTYQVVNHGDVIKPPIRHVFTFAGTLLLARLVFWCTRSG